MKKRIVPFFIIVVTMIVVLVGAVFFWMRQQVPLAVEQVLPQNPLVYVQAVDAAKTWDAFRTTEFWQGLSGIDYISVMKSMGVSDQIVAQHQGLKAGLSSPEVEKMFRLFLGQEAVVAFYPVSVDKVDPQAMAQLSSGLVLVTRLRPEVKMADTLVTMMAKMNKDVKVQNVEFMKKNITVVSAAGSPLKIAYIKIRDLLIISLGEDSIKECLSVYLKKKESLATDANYLAVKAKTLPGTRAVGYLDVKSALVRLKAQIMKLAGAQKENLAAVEKGLDSQLKQYEAFEVFNFSASLDQFYRMKVGIQFNPKAIPPEMLPSFTCSPSENKTMSFVPQDALVYEWSACNDFQNYWQQTMKEMANLPENQDTGLAPLSSIKKLEDVLGKSIEKDIVPILGQEIGGYLRDLDLSGPFPVPEFLAFLSIKDQQKAEDLLAMLAGKQRAVLNQQEVYKGSKITYFSIPMMDKVEPAYCFYNGYLLLAVNRAVLKETLDVAERGTGAIKDQPDFQKLDPKAATKSQGIVFVNTVLLSQKLNGVVDWGQKWVSQQVVKQEAFIAGTEKRLADVKQAMTENDQAIKTLEEEVTSLEADKEKIQEQPAELTRVNGEVDRLQKFIASLEKALEPQLAEEKELLAVKNNPAMLLPPEGESRLKVTQDAIKKKQDKIKSLQEEMNPFLDQKKLLTSVTERRAAVQTTIDQKKEQASQLRGENSARKENQTELESTLSTFQAHRPLSEQQRNVVWDQLVRPFIKCVGKVKGWVSSFSMEENALWLNMGWDLQ